MAKDSNPLVFSTDGSHQKLCPSCGAAPCVCGDVQPVVPQQTTLRLRLEKKGRKGKSVTVVFDLPPEPPGSSTLSELARGLKRHCGTGGGLKEGNIEIQGDQRDKVQQYLERAGYTVRRSGG